MACYSPLLGWQKRQLNDNGKREFTRNPREAYIDFPMSLPCGKCVGCRSAQAMVWAVRCYHESTMHLRNCFVTLTYDDDHLPADGKIVKKDLQDFFKRARKRGLKFRYFAAGEYGEKTRRPHYHAVIFGLDFSDDKETISETLYTSPTLQEIWGKGHVSIGCVSIASIMYVVGYTAKKISDVDTFNLMSRKPGIGADWLSLYMDDLTKDGFCVIDGQKFTIPRFYMRNNEEDFKYVKRKNLELAKAKELDYNQMTAKILVGQSKNKMKKETI